MDVFELEEKFPALSGIKFNGIHAWPLLRIIVGYEIGKKDFKTPATTCTGKLKKISNILRSLKGWGRWLLQRKKYSYVIFTNNLEKRVHKGLYYDRLFHSTTQLLDPKKTLIVNFCEGDVATLEKSYYHNIVNGDLFNYFSIFAGRFIKIQITNEDRKLIGEVLDYAGIQLNYESHLRQFLASASVYERFFRITRPKAIFNGCYTYFPQVFIAKKTGIDVIEFQHGLINPQHRGYRTLLNYENEFTANRLFSFGEKSVYGLDESIYKKEQIRPIGYSYFELMKQGFFDPMSIKNVQYEKVICVPTDSIVEKETIELLVGVAAELEKVLFVLNPRVTLSEEGINRIKEYQNIVSVPGPFQVLVQQCDYNLTILSTCAYEALYFGVPNLLYDYRGYARKIFGNILNEENSFYFSKEQELIDFLRRPGKTDKTSIRREGAMFYAEDHSEKISRELELLKVN